MPAWESSNQIRFKDKVLTFIGFNLTKQLNDLQYKDEVIIEATPSGQFFSSNTAVANTAANPNGTTDLTEMVRREGFIGVNKNPTSSFDGRTLALNSQITANGTISALAHSVILVTTTNALLPNPALYPERILRIVNGTSFPITLTGADERKFINPFTQSSPYTWQAVLEPRTSYRFQNTYSSFLPVGASPSSYAWMATDISKISGVVENIIEFSVNANPNTVGTVFAPVQPQDPDVIYFSTIDNSTWKWNGTSYVTYVALPSTEWNLAGTTTDAGSNKSAAISRSGSTLVGGTATAVPNTKLHVINSGVSSLIPQSGGGEIITDTVSPRLYFEQAGGLLDQKVSFIYQENGYLKISSVTDNGSVFVSNQSVVIQNTTGYVGIGNVTPLTTMHVNGSFSTKLDFFPSTGGTTIVTPTMAGVEIGGSNLAHTVTLPAANAFNGRRIVVKLAGNTTQTIVTINSAGGQVENEIGLLGTSALLQNGLKGGEWQSDGANWQLISANNGGVHRTSASGLLAANIIPNGYNVYQDFNGTWQSNVILPVSGIKTGQILTFEHFASFNTTIEIANSSMTTPLLVTAAMGGASWVWNGIKWDLISEKEIISIKTKRLTRALVAGNNTITHNLNLTTPFIVDAIIRNATTGGEIIHRVVPTSFTTNSVIINVTGAVASSTISLIEIKP